MYIREKKNLNRIVQTERSEESARRQIIVSHSLIFVVTA